MRKAQLATVAAVALLGAAVVAPAGASGAGATTAAPTGDRDRLTSATKYRSYEDNKTFPWQDKYNAIRQAALQKKLRTGSTSDVMRVSGDDYARVEQTGKDKIFVVLAEFGKTEHSAYCDVGEECTYPSDGSPQRVNGPEHNQIPKPDRSVDNATLWKPNYNKAHYDNMYFHRMRKYYERQSMGRYTFGGQITEWVKVPFNEARYGRDYCGSIVCANTWFLIRDALAYWVEQQLKSGQSEAEIRRHLRTFDQQDRYDFDADGNFDERDGYIDHFQIVHAGGDQAAGDPVYGGDAIWSHRWYADINGFGVGPNNGAQFGGVNVGQGGVSDPDGSNVKVPDNPTGVWVGDYTIQPENGGLGVFAHEYAHDLGLPDLYDTSGNTGGAENSTAFWTLMSSGANIGRETDEGIGNNPVDMGAWEKFQLGWLDYVVAREGRRYTHRLNPLSVQGKRPEAMFVLLPKKKVQLELGEPCDTCGERYFYSDAGDEITTTMTREVPPGGGALRAKVRYDIEEGYDYAFLEVSSDGGENWEPVETSESDLDNDCGESCTPGISGSTNGAWVNLTADVPNNTDTLRWRYTTDTAVVEPGFQIDNITLDGAPIGTAETEEGWVFDGFRTTNGSETIEYFNAYVAENRQYRNYDRSLESAYNFGFLDKRPDWVEHYPYQNGLLVNYWDSSYTDNNVGDHPGSGLVLPVDAHPTFTHTPDGALARPRILTYDSTFGLQDTDRLSLHYLSERYRVPSQDNVRVFNDRRDYWYDFDEHGEGEDHPGRYQPGWYSVDVPRTGTWIKVVKVNDKGVMTVNVGGRP